MINYSSSVDMASEAIEHLRHVGALFRTHVAMFGRCPNVSVPWGEGRRLDIYHKPNEDPRCEQPPPVCFDYRDGSGRRLFFFDDCDQVARLIEDPYNPSAVIEHLNNVLRSHGMVQSD